MRFTKSGYVVCEHTNGFLASSPMTFTALGIGPKGDDSSG